MIELGICRLESGRLPEMLPVPSYATPSSAGLDLRAALNEKLMLAPGERRLVPTGFAFEIPVGYEGQVRARSGRAIREGLALVNAPGTIDSDYRGEVSVILINLGQQPVSIERSDRIAQLVICPVVRAACVERAELSETSRGSGGFGHTGR